VQDIRLERGIEALVRKRKPRGIPANQTGVRILSQKKSREVQTNYFGARFRKPNRKDSVPTPSVEYAPFQRDMTLNVLDFRVGVSAHNRVHGVAVCDIVEIAGLQCGIVEFGLLRNLTLLGCLVRKLAFSPIRSGARSAGFDGRTSPPEHPGHAPGFRASA
jgi:hypothetical protein